MAKAVPADRMQIYVFVPFHSRPGMEGRFEEALREVVAATRAEEGRLKIQAFRSVCDRQVFYIHSHWKDRAAFETHARLPHTVRFVECAAPLLDHEIHAQRCELME